MYCYDDPEAELREFCEGTVESPLEVKWRTPLCIRLEGMKFRMDLIPIPFGEISVVVGMNWFDCYKARFECESQWVEIRTPSGGVLLIGKWVEETTEAVFDGENKRIRALLRSQLSALWVMFCDEKIFGCLCVQVELELDLIPGATPVGKVPFRSAPPELSYEAKWESCKGRGSSVQVVHLGGAPILFVRKEDGPMRIYIEYRELNMFTVKNRYPLPRIDDLFDQLLGTAVPSGEGDKRGHAEDCVQIKVRMFRVRSDDVRITNALAISVIVFTYDILIYSKSKGEHVKLLVEVLETLRKERLYYKFSKCVSRMVQFLGNFVNREGIVVDSVKVEAIAKWEMVHPRLLGICDVFGKAYQKHCEVVGVFSVAKSRSSSCLESCATNPATRGRGKKVAVVMRVLLMRLTVMTAVLELIKSSQVDAVKEVNLEKEGTNGQPAHLRV
ncbi:LOW QUALITY PROTEIN: hypothetical protein OSB04_031730 [Centaurea solstitialis]|uniref:Uncharacterized protein n=1 Tax=Centaurea solstitialis TaxID=347529 RepID=A0AA38VXV4_9ASTR|nr:LOW QUALITY PROTEIN: hypothetical protein OSB04_031730 [Centaurea solstitialis]